MHNSGVMETQPRTANWKVTTTSSNFQNFSEGLNQKDSMILHISLGLTYLFSIGLVETLSQSWEGPVFSNLQAKTVDAFQDVNIEGQAL